MRSKAMLLIGMIWALSIALLYPLISGGTVHAAPLNTCSGAGGPKCYAVVFWDNPILGAIARINTVGLFSVNDNLNHISEEL